MPRADRTMIGPPKPLGWRKIIDPAIVRERERLPYGPPRPRGYQRPHRRLPARPTAVPEMVGEGYPSEWPTHARVVCWCGRHMVHVAARLVGTTAGSCGAPLCEGPDHIEGGVEYWEPTTPFCGWQMPPDPPHLRLVS